ncbi:hypothetical protein GEMRC1_009119 [Eukaryota sp. GEM-RC1]
MRILCVAEKPSAARSITTILSQNTFTVHEGYSKYNKVFAFSANINGQSDWKVTSVSGHIFDVSFPDEYSNWSSVDPRSLFSVRLNHHIAKSSKNIARTLEKEAKSAQVLVIATDADREGEAIGNSIATVCCKVNPRLTVTRPRFSSLTASAIHTAFSNPGTLNQGDIDAVAVRQELDYRVGCAFTRYLTISLKPFLSFSQLKTCSFGPCQTPTLKIIVDAFNSNKHFIPQPFWGVDVRLGNGITLTWSETRVFDKNEALGIVQQCIDQSLYGATLTAIHTNSLEKVPPLPLTTVDLQKSMSSQYRISAKDTLDIAEKLYLKGLITYPRTETNKISNISSAKDILGKVVRANDNPTLSSVMSSIDLNSIPTPKSGRKSDEAHDPIMPAKGLKMSDYYSLSSRHILVLEYIIRRFIAIFLPTASAVQKQHVFHLAGHEFHFTSATITQSGWIIALPWTKWPQHKQSNDVNLRLNDLYEVNSVNLTEDQTKPPPLISESTLIEKMERFSIGTDATMASHIETNIDRKYVTRKPRTSTLIPTTVGIALISAFESVGLAICDTSIRSDMESDIANVARGNLTKNQAIERGITAFRDSFDVLEASIRPFKSVFSRTMNSVETVTVSHVLNPNFIPCKCGQTLSLATSQDDYVLQCNSCDFSTTLPFFASSDKKVVPKEPLSQCPHCQSFVVEVEVKQGFVVPFCVGCHFGSGYQQFVNCWSCTKYECVLAQKNRDKLNIYPCPVCKDGHWKLRKAKKDQTKTFIGCSNFPKCRQFLQIPSDFSIVSACSQCNSPDHCVVSVFDRNVCTNTCDSFGFLLFIKQHNPSFNPCPTSSATTLPKLPKTASGRLKISTQTRPTQQIEVETEEGVGRKCGICSVIGHNRRTCPQR